MSAQLTIGIAPHARIWKLFPDAPAESRQAAEERCNGFLFRVEDNRPGRPSRVLIQSRPTPRAAAGIDLIATRPLNPRPSKGQQLAFLLAANPIKTIEDQQFDAKPSRRRKTCRAKAFGCGLLLVRRLG